MVGTKNIVNIFICICSSIFIYVFYNSKIIWDNHKYAELTNEYILNDEYATIFNDLYASTINEYSMYTPTDDYIMYTPTNNYELCTSNTYNKDNISIFDIFDVFSTGVYPDDIKYKVILSDSDYGTYMYFYYTHKSNKNIKTIDYTKYNAIYYNNTNILLKFKQSFLTYKHHIKADLQKKTNEIIKYINVNVRQIMPDDHNNLYWDLLQKKKYFFTCYPSFGSCEYIKQKLFENNICIIMEFQHPQPDKNFIGSYKITELYLMQFGEIIALQCFDFI
jgi:hypothetical protein